MCRRGASQLWGTSLATTGTQAVYASKLVPRHNLWRTFHTQKTGVFDAHLDVHPSHIFLLSMSHNDCSLAAANKCNDSLAALDNHATWHLQLAHAFWGSGRQPAVELCFGCAMPQAFHTCHPNTYQQQWFVYMQAPNTASLSP